MPDAMTLLSSAVNEAISSDPANRDHFRSLGNICLLVQSQAPDLSAYVQIDDGIVSLHRRLADDNDLDDTPKHDLRISATALSLAKLVLNPADNAAALRDANVHVEGDVALLLELSQVIKKIDVDWEALLAEKIGDSAAVLFSRGVKKAKDTTSSTFETQKKSIEEWLRKPGAPVPTRTEYEELKTKLRDLNYRLDRLDAALEQSPTDPATSNK